MSASIYNEFFRIDGSEATCKTCADIVQMKNRNRTGLLRHLQRKHEDHAARLEEIRRNRKHEDHAARLEEMKKAPVSKKRRMETTTPSIKSAFASWEQGGTRDEGITRALSLMIALDSQPVSMVDRPGFRHFLKVAIPSYKLRSRTTISRTFIPDLYNEFKLKVTTRIQSAEYVSFTTDSWSSEDNRHSLLSLTAHWCCGNRLIYRVLGVLPVHGRHDSANFSTLITSCLDDFLGEDAKRKAYIVVRDAASVMQKTMKICGLESIDCFAHKLQLAIYSGLKNAVGDEQLLTSLTERIKKFVRKLRKSGVDRDEFESLRQLEDIPPRWLVKGIVVRWSSLYNMLERFAENRHVISTFCIERQDYPRFTGADYVLVEKLLKTLKPFKEATVMLQGRSVTISVVIPTIFVLRRSLPEEDIAKSILANLEDRVKSIENYPRFTGADYVLVEKLLKTLKPFKEATVMLQGRSVTISVVIPTIFVLRRSLPEEDIAKSILANLEDRVKNIESDPKYVVATLLDVRFKKDFIEPEKAEAAIALLNEEATKTLLQISQKEDGTPHDIPPRPTHEAPTSQPMAFFERFRSTELVQENPASPPLDEK
uniref:BED-type domain-containing protein n=1 Tax=Steinernema glaseri TaxID=37863 RepID=A0A1I7Z1B1_9BILA